MKRKTEKAFAELFDITWGSEGVGQVRYEVAGNLVFKNKVYSNKEIGNTKDLELGTYNIKCIITSESGYEANSVKQVKITSLANTSVENDEGSNVVANAIYSEYDLAYFRDLVNNRQFNINGKLMNDINLITVSSVENGGWKPIGYFDGIGNWTGPCFSGIFCGNEHTITILSLSDITNASEYKNVSLFGMIIGGKVENLSINGNISSNGTVAGIVSDIKDGIIYKCINNATITEKSVGIVGGIVGTSMNSTIQDCINNANINGQSTAGGIVGFAYENSKIKNCSNTGNIICYNAKEEYFYNSALTFSCAGGIVGMSMNYSTITQCSNNGKITADLRNISANYVCLGGIVGRMNNNCNVSMSKNESLIEYEEGNNGLIGGIVGYIVDNSVVNQCYNQGNISGRKNSIVGSLSAGGIAGWNDGSKIKNSYNIAGKVYGLDTVGGIIGGVDKRFSSNSAYIYNCYSTTVLMAGTYYGTFGGNLRDVEIKNCCFISDTKYTGLECENIVWTSWKFLSINEMKTINSGLLAMLNNNDGIDNNIKLWAQSENVNSGFPYLINNMPL